ncbi:uncharacterized protein BDR25DRAFT_341728 [Lindgomyces ingoldianus]|uniref:Uncharacterized protein n=1 Tax=Lindgomyces ingoldianus TaxID=673940 RepID=A0ACB6R361_9PLEO|nr:uncharacterized protein BDR25DRAFT_341728 [Lindgomyces ingoldianus]KAF2472947.1 hypothetical protein BDR25DRAFT_341728 [Lindgomyces ingoldianus]
MRQCSKPRRRRSVLEAITLVACFPVWFSIGVALLAYDRSIVPGYKKVKDRIVHSQRWQLWKRRREFPNVMTKGRGRRRSISSSPPQLSYMGFKLGKRKARARGGGFVPGLLRLPTEIRQMIWGLVFDGEMRIHIEVRERRIIAMRCEDPVKEDEGWVKTCACQEATWVVLHADGNETEYPKQGIRALPLLLTCRPMYTDILDYVYRTSTFVFHRPETLLVFSHSIPQSHSQSLTKIHFDSRTHSYAGSARTHPSFVHTLDHLPVPIRKAHKSALSAQCLPFTVENAHFKNVKFEKLQPSTWGAMCEALTSLSGLRELRISLNWSQQAVYGNLGPVREGLQMRVEANWMGKGSRGEEEKLGFVVERMVRERQQYHWMGALT